MNVEYTLLVTLMAVAYTGGTGDYDPKHVNPIHQPLLYISTQSSQYSDRGQNSIVTFWLQKNKIVLCHGALIHPKWILTLTLCAEKLSPPYGKYHLTLGNNFNQNKTYIGFIERFTLASNVDLSLIEMNNPIKYPTISYVDWNFLRRGSLEAKILTLSRTLSRIQTFSGQVIIGGEYYYVEEMSVSHIPYRITLASSLTIEYDKIRDISLIGLYQDVVPAIDPHEKETFNYLRFVRFTKDVVSEIYSFLRNNDDCENQAIISAK